LQHSLYGWRVWYSFDSKLELIWTPPKKANSVADFLLRDIDERVANRVKEIARQKGWPLNDVLLHLIKQSLGYVEPEPAPVPGDIARLNGAWNDDESRAFMEAMNSFNQLPDDAPSYITDKDNKN
jgi:hypothetical protein